MSVGAGSILLNARHWIMRAMDHRYTAAIQPPTFTGPTPLTSTIPIRLQITALPTNAVGIFRYCMRTFSAAMSAARSGFGPDTAAEPWDDMRRSYTQRRCTNEAAPVGVCNLVVLICSG